MAQVIASNIPSLNAQSQLNRSNAGLNQALERLSSGKRINNAKDDAAGIAIASRFTAQIRGYNQGTRNAADAISMTQTAEGAMAEMSANVQRVRELAVQSANGTNSDTDRSALQAEVSALQAEVQRVTGTKFNGIALLSADAGAATFQVGPDGGGANKITITTENMGGHADTVAFVAGDVNTSGTASGMIELADDLLETINTERAKLGATQNRFESVIRNGENAVSNLSASRSRIEDADFAAETANLTKYQILQQAGTSVLSQANALPQSVLGLLG